ncbi:MAG TPA: hypothetical protein VN937_10485 [Blastocatellia bacterium]|nr:hypothetical protein [Blastocatellia bacterium]
MTSSDLLSQTAVTQLPNAGSRATYLYRLVICLAMLVFLSTNARADGIDLVPFLTRVGGWRVHPVVSVGLVIGLMLVNYLVNLAVIAVPAARVSEIKFRTLARDLIGFTFLAQIADRVAAVAGLFIGLFIIDRSGVHGEEGLLKGFLVGIALNFVFAGVAIGFLAFRYLGHRWGILKRPAIVIAIAAGVFTNPAWLMAVYAAKS